MDGNWDKPLPPHFRTLMVKNFEMLVETKNLLYQRCSILEDALYKTTKLIVFGDAAQPAMMSGAYGSHE